MYFFYHIRKFHPQAEAQSRDRGRRRGVSAARLRASARGARRARPAPVHHHGAHGQAARNPGDFHEFYVSFLEPDG